MLGRVILQGRPPLRFDLASIDIGIGSDLPEVAGYAEHGVAAKPLGAYAEAWEAFVARALPTPRVVIIGGGVGGVELALATAHRLTKAGAKPAVTVVERSEALPNIGTAAREALLRHVRAAGIVVLTGVEALRIGAAQVLLSTGQEFLRISRSRWRAVGRRAGWGRPGWTCIRAMSRSVPPCKAAICGFSRREIARI